jgi:ribonuclease P protein component
LKKNSFRRTRKIKKRSEIYSLYNDGTRWINPAIEIYYYPNNQKHSRIAIIVSKKNGKAAIRNKIKRCIREILRTKTGNFRPHLDVLIKVSLKKDTFKRSNIEEAINTWDHGKKR